VLELRSCLGRPVGERESAARDPRWCQRRSSATRARGQRRGERRTDRRGAVVATSGAAVLTENQQLAGINADYEERYGFHDAENYLYKAPKGLNREIVEKISEFKAEPTWMREFRLKALDHFFARQQPTWGSPMLAELDYDDIRYFVRA
jgi:hypothetical protein